MGMPIVRLHRIHACAGILCVQGAAADQIRLKSGARIMGSEDSEVAEDDAFPSARGAVTYEQGLLSVECIRFFHFQEGLVAFEDARAVVVRTRSGFQFNLGRDFVVTLQLNLNWDNNPAPGNTSTDEEYLFTLGYQW